MFRTKNCQQRPAMRILPKRQELNGKTIKVKLKNHGSTEIVEGTIGKTKFKAFPGLDGGIFIDTFDKSGKFQSTVVFEKDGKISSLVTHNKNGEGFIIRPKEIESGKSKEIGNIGKGDEVRTINVVA